MSFSYNFSLPLKESLQKIEIARRKMLLTPISPKEELKIRWAAKLGRIYWSLNISGNPLTRSEMAKIISKSVKKPSPEEKEVINYKNALDYISTEWLVTGKPVTAKIILNLHDIASPSRFVGNQIQLKQVLDYLEANPENPIIQAAIIQIELIKLKLFADGNARTARLAALLFLYKAGYDFRGFLTLEEQWRHDLPALRQISESLQDNLTGWLEYFSDSFAVHLEKVIESISTNRLQVDLSPSFGELNNRQKEVLEILEEPGSAITNRNVQKKFNVSQITASRDLAKLASFGLVFARGKGRSVTYSKV